MAKHSKSGKPVKSKADLEMIKGKENLLIEKEKRYQRVNLGPQVENQTTLKETKKKKAPKPVTRKKG